MQELYKQASDLLGEVNDALGQLDIDGLNNKLKDINKKTADPNLWRDQAKAQKLMKQQASITERVKPWREIEKSLKDIVELSKTGDETLKNDLAKQLKNVKQKFSGLKQELMYGGEYDDHGAILSIYAGAGGTDAQDWAEMLLRMYLRWAENKSFNTDIIDKSAGDEAGIKSVSVEIDGSFAYGKLKGEHGVHRLVRLSPFNADNLRQTSFAKVEVSPKINEPSEVEIDNQDLRIDFFRSGGRGGQSVNTTDSAVRVTHLPTKITVSIQNERSQQQNKETALTVLMSRLVGLQEEQHAEKISELKGPNEEAAWGNQIRNYVLHPYKQVKDLRSKHESSDPDAVLDGKLDEFIKAYLESNLAT